MARHKDTEQNTLPAPALLAPRGAEVIDGGAVTFRWAAVEGVVEYLLEIATDSTFENVILEERIPGDQVTATLSGQFAPESELYFWRVLARNEAGWSNGDHVESFIAGTPEEAAQHFTTPDERLGPYPALIRSAAVEAAGEVTGEERYFEEEARDGVEHEGVEVGQILGLALAILAAVVVAIVSIFLVYDQAARVAMAEAVTVSGYPELQEAEIEAARQLTQYDVIDREQGVYQIPIDQAMDLLIREQAAQQGGRSFSQELPLLSGSGPSPSGSTGSQGGGPQGRPQPE